MTNAILRGKPDAGNPHVRFDEGEVASAKPRRGSLLYNKHKLLVAAVLITAEFAFAETFTWTGAQDAYWTNAANWTVGGVASTRFPGVLLTGTDKVAQTNDYAAQDADADVAKFEGAFARNVLNLDGLFSVKNVTITGADTPSVVFGAAEGQPLPIGYRGTLTIEASVLRTPTFPYGIVMGKGNQNTSRSVKFTLTQNSPQPLHIAGPCTDTSDVRYTGSWWLSCPYFYGKGDIVFDGKVKFVTIMDAYFYSLGKVVFNADWGGLRGFSVQTAGRHDFVVGEGVTLTWDRNIGHEFSIGANIQATFTGGGTLVYNNAKEHQGGYACQWNVNSSSMLKLDGPMLRSNLSNANNDGGLMDTYNNAGPHGMLDFVTTNAITGPIKLYSQGVMRTPAIGAAGDASPVGCGSEIIFARGSTLAYAGSGETTTRLIAITNAGTCAGTLMQDGTGAWTVASPIVARAGNATLILKNGTDAPATLATALADTDDNGVTRAFSLEKSGSGNWTLTGVNTYTGATTVDGGTLTLAVGASIAATSGVELKNGGELVIEGDEPVTLPAITLTSGANVIRLTGSSTTATLPAPAFVAGTLNIRTATAAATVLIPELKESGAPAGLYMNGVRATVDGDGKVSPDPAYGAVIAASGDVVPDLPDRPVVVAFAGTGDAANTLAQDATSVGSLVQTSAFESTVALGEGQTLTADKIAVESASAALTIGDEPGKGTLSSTAALLFANGSESALTVNAALQPGTEAWVKGGTSPVTLAGGANGTLVLKQTAGDVVVTGAQTYDFEYFTVGTNGTASTPVPKIIFDGAKDVWLGKIPCRVGPEYRSGTHVSHGACAMMFVTNSLIRNHDLMLTDFGTDRPADGFEPYTGYGLQIGDRSYGELYIQAGAVITNRLMLGNAFDDQHTGCGTVYQDGGEIFALGQDGGTHYSSHVGNRTSHGYYELNAGKLGWGGNGGVAGYASGILVQHGGEMFVTNTLGNAKGAATTFCVGFANSGRGQMVFLGGTTKFANAYLKTCGASTYSDGGGEIVLAANGNVDCGQIPLYTGLNDGPTNGVGITATHDCVITLAGGLLRTAGFGQAGDPVKRRNRAVVNFNGGTLKLSRDSQNVFKYGTYYAMSTVTVFSAGAVIDTDGRIGNKSTVSLQGPVGGGVSGFAAGAFPKTFRTCPSIRIVGDGFGASAYPVWNRETKQVTDVVIVAPGTGYSNAKLRFYINEEVSQTAVDCTIAESPNTGSFTKRGEGDFTFMAENTYGGRTILEGGTLILGVPNALPTTTSIVPRGGILEATADNFPTALTVDVSELDPEAKSVTFARMASGELAAPPAVTVVGGEPGQDWHVTSAGGVFRVGVRKGTMLIVR